jgi:disease resistance protein
MDTKKICKRQGCRKEFTEIENSETACKYHDGKPIFHNLKKGWTCCNITVYDWDEFQKIQGCKVANHTSENQDTEFFKSQTVSNAEKGIQKFSNSEVKTEVKSIQQYEEEQKRKEEEKKKLEQNKPREIIKANDGKYYCGNPGCADKTFDPENNHDGSCKHHTALPVFHEIKKMWACCKQETYDWDDFMKLPQCTVGKHTPKYKN